MQLAVPPTNGTALQLGSVTCPLLAKTLKVTVPVTAIPVTDALRVTGAPKAATLVLENSAMATASGVTLTLAEG